MKKLVYYLKQILMNLRNVNRLLMLILLTGVIAASCKKDEPEPVQPDSTPVQQLSRDDSSVEENIDEALIDAGQVLAGKGSMEKAGLPCNVIVDSVYMSGDTVIYHLTYLGLNCIKTRYRSGTVLIKIRENTQWYLPGAIFMVEFYNYAVTNVYSGKKMTLNGMARLENVSGGVIELLGHGITTVIHKNVAHLDIAFNGNPPRDWHLTRLQAYSGVPGELVLAVNGFGTAQGYNNLVSWGTDRDGQKFYTQITESVVFRETCNWLSWGGKQVYDIPAQNLKATVTFGFNDNNEPIAPNECPTRYRIDWQQNSQTGTIFLPLINP
jgi:hypothetical protein